MTATDDLNETFERLNRAKGAAAQICVIRDDQTVYARTLGCTPDALFCIYSCSKPFVALLVHLLAERRQLKLDDPVADYWPRFARHGKGAVTIRHVLQHRAGLPMPCGILKTLLHMPDWDKSILDIEEAKPQSAAGAVPAYHFISYGFILGELVQRVTGHPVRQVLADELLDPLGLNEIHLGLPDEALPRAVKIIAGDLSEIVNQWQFNRRRVRQSVIPAAGISTNATQLARFYQVLLGGGELEGARVLPASAIVEARRPSSDGVDDTFLNRPVRWAQGFQLGGPGQKPDDMAKVMGVNSSPDTFGHAGNASCVTWADPARNLVLVYLSNIQPKIDKGLRQLSMISDAVLDVFG